MRNQFIKRLIKHQEIYQNIFLLVGDLGYSLIEPFKEKFPNNFYNVGIAEQNMASIASGLASEGYKVFIYSIANFNTFRCAEQLRNDVDYHNFDVTVVSVGGGSAYGHLGYSHHALQDYSLIRSLPNFMIFSPADIIQIDYCMDAILDSKSPKYLRLHKANENNFTPENLKFNIKKPIKIFNNTSKNEAIISTGFIGNYLFHNELMKHNLNFYNLLCWGENSRNELEKFLNQYNKIYIFEDHLYAGGFSSWLLETNALIGNNKVKLIPKFYSREIIGNACSENYALKNFIDYSFEK